MAGIANKENFLKPIEGEFRATFVYRKKTKGGKPRYYLYTQDEEENLIIAAQRFDGYHVIYRISTSGTEFDKEEGGYFGKIHHVDNINDYKVFKVENGQKTMEIMTTFVKTNGGFEKVLKIDFEGQPISAESVPFEEFTTEFPNVEVKESRFNYYIKREGKPLLVFYCTEEDEYQIIAKGPLSIFTAFSTALSIMFGNDK